MHIVHFCVARTVKLKFFFTEVSDCELVGDEWGWIEGSMTVEIRQCGVGLSMHSKIHPL